MGGYVQIARECGVPIVQVGSEEMACIPDDVDLELDSSQGIRWRWW